MSIWILAAIIFNVFVVLSIAILWIRQTRPAKEDPRLSRGLQLLQSKISVLEDLSDRTESQVRQLIQILDEKAKGLQNKMLQAQDTIRQIENSMHKSLNVAEIFQDKIPHEEIIERNQQSKYVVAAKLANEGKTVDEILAQVDLPRSEVEFISKVNREDLTFDPELLPEWAKTKEPSHKQEIEAQMVERVFQPQKTDLSALTKIENDFKKTVREVEEIERIEAERQRQFAEKAQALKQSASQMTQNAVHMTQNAVHLTQNAMIKTQDMVRKVQFPRITVDRPRWKPATKDDR